ncbi:MAG: hypothetical protein FJ125_09585 [Deltaproteobacteria bacterium]|nr:hypothetical protein [Deltaproteobacteria bacterium]
MCQSSFRWFGTHRPAGQQHVPQIPHSRPDVVQIWDGWRQKQPRRFRVPPVLPLVLYHGRKRWGRIRSLHDQLRSAGQKGSRLYLASPWPQRDRQSRKPACPQRSLGRL